jgi:hypothetical protein
MPSAEGLPAGRVPLRKSARVAGACASCCPMRRLRHGGRGSGCGSSRCPALRAVAGRQTQAGQVPGESLQRMSGYRSACDRFVEIRYRAVPQPENSFEISRQQCCRQPDVEALQKNLATIGKSNAVPMYVASARQANHGDLRGSSHRQGQLRVFAEALQAQARACRHTDGRERIGRIDEAQGATPKSMKHIVFAGRCEPRPVHLE